MLLVLLLVQELPQMSKACPLVEHYQPVSHDVFHFNEPCNGSAIPDLEWRAAWWQDALDRVDIDIPPAILDETWRRLSVCELDFVLRGPSGGLDLEALRPKQHLPQGPIQGGIHSFVLPEFASMDEHVAWSTSLPHPSGTAPAVEHVPHRCYDSLCSCHVAIAFIDFMHVRI